MPWSKTRPRSADYGSAHAKARKAAVERHSPSDPCYRCQHPLGPMSRNLHYDHLDDRSGYGGFSHGAAPCPTCGKKCNIRAAALVANRRQRHRQSLGTTSGCKYCGTAIAEGRSYCTQRCAYLADPDRKARTPKRVERTPRPYQPPTQSGQCIVCDASLPSTAKTYCGITCRTEGNARNARERYRAKVGLPSTEDRPVKRHATTNREW